MSHLPENYIYTNAKRFRSGEAYIGLEPWRQHPVALELEANTLTHSELFVVENGIATLSGTTMKNRVVTVSPGTQKHILVAYGSGTPPGVRVELFVYGTRMFHDNPVPVVAVHHRDASTVYNPDTPQIDLVPPKEYFITVIPQPGWLPVGFDNVTSERQNDLVHIRAITTASYGV
jgi:hypothetical protein